MSIRPCSAHNPATEMISLAYAIPIQLSRRRLLLYKYGSLLRCWPVGVGKNATPTPQGRYTIVNKRPRPGGPFGAMWLGLSQPGYGIHGTNNPSSIGGLVSKGCIRMYNQDVLALAGLVPVGTPVTITS